MTTCSPCLENSRGFTLLELLTVLAVVGILATLAVPNFSEFIASNRVSAAASTFQVAMITARSEAVKRNATVTLSPNAGGWANGWRMLDAGGAVINVEDPLRNVDISSPTDSVVYLNSGRVSGTAPSFQISDRTRIQVQRCVTSDLSGRPYVEEGAC